MEFFHYLRVGDSQYIPPSSSSALYTHPDIFISAVWFLNEVKVYILLCITTHM